MIKLNISKQLHGSNGEMELKIDTTIEDKSFVCIGGDSGSGKSTFLRILAGLEESNSYIQIDGNIWQDKQTFLPPQKRKIGFVFQDYALFENMSVEKNLLYVNKNRELATKLLDMTNLSELKNRYPASLSGGQKQRVSLCRAMMNEPKLLLLDEPLSALDPSMRTKLQDDILALHQEFGTISLMISHEPSEMYKLANRVMIIKDGNVIKDGLPKEILLKTKGSQKFSFEGKILDIIKVDILHIAIISIGQQLVEIVLDTLEASELKVGDSVLVGTKAFMPTLKKV